MTRPSGFCRSFPPVILLVACALLLFLNSRSKPAIILITIDALRADHLHCYGYPRATSPAIDALASRGAVFTACYSAASYTAPSVVSLLSGRYMDIRANEILWDDVVDGGVTTLAEYLRVRGYRTAAFVANELLGEAKGFGQGFDTYRVLPGKDAFALNDAVFASLSRTRRDRRPLFLWVHYFDTHAPYDEHPDSFPLFAGDALYARDRRRAVVMPEGLAARDMIGDMFSRGYIPRRVAREGREEVNYYVACYDSEIRHADRALGELLGRLKVNGQDGLVVVTADHGEAMGEHGTYFSHGEDLYEGSIGVPLIIKFPGGLHAGKRSALPVSGVDLVPTVLGALRAPLPGQGIFDGIDLGLVLAGKRPRREFIFSYNRRLRCIRDTASGAKLIVNAAGAPAGFYALPDEARDLGPDAAGAGPLRRELFSWLAAHPVAADSAPRRAGLDPEMRARLRAVGYAQ